MKAVAFVAPGQMELRELPDPTPGPGEIVVKVSYSGICGSDLHEYASPAPSLRAAGFFQPVMGHEFTGTVTALAPGVDGLSAGDSAAIHPGGSCGDCYYCRAGASNLCGDQLATGYRLPGGFAEYAVVRASQAYRLPDASWLERAALTEPLGVALRAVNRGVVTEGDTVFVAGGGPIGLLSLLAARRHGARLVIVSEPAAIRRELALRLGADHAVDPAQSASVQVRDITQGLGCDVAIEAVGVSQTMDDCLAATRRGGRIVVAGVFEQPYLVNLLTLLAQELSIIGTFGYTRNEFQEAVDLITSGAVDVRPLISRSVSLEELPAAFAELTADRGRDQKVLVRPHA